MSDFLAQMTAALGVPGRWMVLFQPCNESAERMIARRIVPNLASPRPQVTWYGSYTVPSDFAYMEVEPGWFVQLQWVDERWHDGQTYCYCTPEGDLQRENDWTSAYRLKVVWSSLDLPVLVQDCYDEDDEDDKDEDHGDEYNDEPDDEDPF